MDVKTTITLTLDLNELKKQKAWLQAKNRQPFIQPEIEGLLNLIDAIQDNMVDNEKVPLKDVFGDLEENELVMVNRIQTTPKPGSVAWYKQFPQAEICQIEENEPKNITTRKIEQLWFKICSIMWERHGNGVSFKKNCIQLNGHDYWMIAKQYGNTSTIQADFNYAGVIREKKSDNGIDALVAYWCDWLP